MKEKAQRLITEVKNFQLDEIQSRMDDERQGVEIESNGVKYVAFIRRLTPTECGRLQGIPEWFNWNDTSESQVYRELGNGWQVDTIKHCFSFMPKFDRPIRVWSLFDGMACCHIALKELDIPIESYISSEVDKAAIATEIRNFPDMIQVGDVTKIDVADLVAKYGVPDLLTAGSPCFVAGTKVLTLEGYKNIEDVKVGDMVLTHNNRYRKVLNVGGHEDDVFGLSTLPFEGAEVTCTANHPFWAKENLSDEPKWIRADELVREENSTKNLYIAFVCQNGSIEWEQTNWFEPVGREMVYNLEVEEDNSYTANNIIVHNCQSFSFSGKMKGMSTATGEEIYTLDRYLELKKEGFQFEGQSYLFWEFMRILTELREYNPNILYFLENVKMLEKWERCLSHAVGIRGVHINSALVSAQSRQRIYWSNFRVRDLGSASLFDFSDDPFHLPDYETDIPQPEDRGIVINDILDDAADSKYYLRDEIVKKLMEKTDKFKLVDYLKEPQVSVEELLDELNTNPEYAGMSDEEKRELAESAYAAEAKLLDELYNGKRMLPDEDDEDEQEG